MKIDRTPWARDRMTAEEVGTLRVALPDEYRLDLSARSAGGPFTASLTYRRRLVSLTQSRLSPFQAAVDAMGVAAGDIDEQALGRQLAASLRAIGIDPDGVGEVA